MQLISIVLEGLIALLFAASAAKGRPCLYGLTVTFGIYVYYDLVKLYEWNIAESSLRLLFFVATVSALYSSWMLFRRKD